VKDAKPASVFWALDLSKRSRPEEFRWIELPTWPGVARIVPVAAAQRTKNGEEFFLFSGRVQQAGQRTQILRDAYAFNPKTRTWRTLPAIGGGAGVSVMAGTAVAVGENEILLFGGDRGDVFLELETHDVAIAAARAKLNSAAAEMRVAIEREIDARLRAKRKIYDTHAGFGREVFAYDTIRDTWRVAGESPFPPQVTTTAVRWRDAIVIPSGEVRPGVRTPSVVRAKLVLK
jgi:N-acetylneuraminic acid mutarotase